MAYERSVSALCSSTRRGIFESLRAGPLAVGQIAKGVPVRGVAMPSRRQLVRKILMLGTSLVVARPTRAIAAPGPVMKSTARQEVKIDEENRLMPEIMHLIKIGAPQDKVNQAVSTTEGLPDCGRPDAAAAHTCGRSG